MANRTSRGADAPSAAPAATPARLGYFLDEEAHLRLKRAEAIAGLIAGLFGQCLDATGRPMLLDARQIAALGELLELDLQAGLEAAHWGRWQQEVRHG